MYATFEAILRIKVYIQEIKQLMSIDPVDMTDNLVKDSSKSMKTCKIEQTSVFKGNYN